MSSTDRRLEAQIKKLREEIVGLRAERVPTTTNWSDSKRGITFKSVSPLKLKRNCYAKEDGVVLNVDFDSRQQMLTLAAGASASGSVIVWNVALEEKKHYVMLPTPWMMTAKIKTKASSTVVGVGGLENSYYLYDLGQSEEAATSENPTAQLAGHGANISDSCFISSDYVATASGDKSVRVWDINSLVVKAHLQAHTSDVFCCAANPVNESQLLSGAGDYTARVYDIRQSQGQGGRRAENVFSFDTQSRDVNGVNFFPSGDAFACALNNTLVQIYDIRASCKLATYADTRVMHKTGAEQVVFSPSGRLMFVRYADHKAYAYDLTSTPVDNDNVNGPLNDTALYEVDTGATRGTESINHLAVDTVGGCLAVAIEKNNGSSDSLAKVFWPIKGKLH